jgi:hypothetical protein
MRWVTLKSVEQQALLSLHRVRQGLLEERTATINRLRGVVTLPWFHVHQKFGNFLMNGGRHGKEGIGSESAVHGGVQDGSGQVGTVNRWQCGSETAWDSAIDHNELGSAES